MDTSVRKLLCIFCNYLKTADSLMLRQQYGRQIFSHKLPDCFYNIALEKNMVFLQFRISPMPSLVTEPFSGLPRILGENLLTTAIIRER